MKKSCIMSKKTLKTAARRDRVKGPRRSAGPLKVSDATHIYGVIRLIPGGLTPVVKGHAVRPL